jgi:hypothetical protein
VRVRHLTWTDDPLVAQTVQHIESTCISEEIDFKSIEIDRASTDSDSNVFEMLCLAAHGEALARLGLAADGRAAPTTASIVPTVDLALLLICDGDHALPNRMLSAGARACVAPAGRAGVEAAQTLAGTLIEQLHQGANVAAACAAARAAVRALAHPAPDMRWHRWRVHMSSLEPQVLCGLAAESAAHEAARRGGSGFVGLEHLILHPPPSFDAQLRYACRQSAPLVARHLALFEPPEHDAPMAETPRLAAGGPSTDAARQLLNALTGRSIHTPTVGGTTMGRSAPERRAAIGFEVLGGPEDGRVIRPADGETIGRYSAQPRADHLLYSAVGAWDPKTSRCHVRWLGGAVEIIAHAVVDGRPVEPGDRLPVQVGTIVQLGGVTRLVGWAPEPGA